jgi:hypothetical protein
MISIMMAAIFLNFVAGIMTIDTKPPRVDGLTAQQSELLLQHSWTRTDGIHRLVRRQLQLNIRAIYT